MALTERNGVTDGSSSTIQIKAPISEATLKDAVAKGPGTTDAAAKLYEDALLKLGKLYQREQKPAELAELVSATRSELSNLPKAKTAKIGKAHPSYKSLPNILLIYRIFLVRQLLDLFAPIPNTVDTQIDLTKSCIEWAISSRRGFLRQSLETRLVGLYMRKALWYDALTLINSLLRELKRLDDKLVLVEVQLLESEVYHALGNLAKARAALTSARTSAASVYTPPLLQAGLDLQSGKLHAEDGDFTTAYSYFIEAMEGYHGQDSTEPATSALQYMLLCKIMLNAQNDVNSLMTSKHALKYSGPQLDAMKSIAAAHANRSLSEYENALSTWRRPLGNDAFIRSHLQRLYDAMLEQNLVKVIEPFSRVEIAHVAKMIGLDVGAVERKLSQMILDKIIIGVLDQGEGCLIVYDENERDQSYDAALKTIEKLSSVVDVLYTNQAALLE